MKRKEKKFIKGKINNRNYKNKQNYRKLDKDVVIKKLFYFDKLMKLIINNFLVKLMSKIN